MTSRRRRLLPTAGPASADRRQRLPGRLTSASPNSRLRGEPSSSGGIYERQTGRARARHADRADPHAICRLSGRHDDQPTSTRSRLNRGVLPELDEALTRLNGKLGTRGPAGPDTVAAAGAARSPRAAAMSKPSTTVRVVAALFALASRDRRRADSRSGKPSAPPPRRHCSHRRSSRWRTVTCNGRCLNQAR